MTDENLIKQIEAILNDLKAGDETALDRLSTLLGDRIEVGDITGSTAVAIGSQISITVNQTGGFPTHIETRLVELAERLEALGTRGWQAQLTDTEKRPIRIFLSSPGDVTNEREAARRAIRKVQNDPRYKDWVELNIVAWDEPGQDMPMIASKTPQGAINEGLATPAQCDIVVTIFWSKMGTPLPLDDYVKPEAFRFPNDSGFPLEQYYSGTEWEYINAMEAAQACKAAGQPERPVVLLYRRTAKPELFDEDRKKLAANFKQYQLLVDFFDSFTNPDGSIRQGINFYETSDEFERVFEQHLRRVIAMLMEQPRQAQTGKVTITPDELRIDWPEDESPFPGLRAFTPADRDVFYGREKETVELLNRLNQGRFLTVVGASGSGKSSLVGAGLIPRLAGNGHSDWLLPTYNRETRQWAGMRFTPGELKDPFDVVASKLAPLTGASPRELSEILSTQPEQLPDLLKAALNGKKRGALYEMITRPAKVTELAFEEDLDWQILDDTGDEPGALALVAYTLEQLWQHRTAEGLLTWEVYDSFGGDGLTGVEGAIGAQAQMAYTRLVERLDGAAWKALQTVFRELVGVNRETGAATRRRADLAPFLEDDACRTLIYELTDARLLVAGQDEDGNEIIEVAHEALFRSWPVLANWITETRDDIVLLRQVITAAQEWQVQGRSEAFRWPHERLVPVYEMLERMGHPRLEPVVQDFIRPEYDRLWEQINDPATHHRDRASIGDRLDELGDCQRRPGVGIVTDNLVPLPGQSNAPALGGGQGSPTVFPTSLQEVRLWGDRPEHLGLPDIVWLPVKGTEAFEIKDNKDGKVVGTFPVPDFHIARYPVTYRQYRAFIDDPEGWHNPDWWEGLAADDDDKGRPGDQNRPTSNHPAERVSWYAAMAFCRWLNARLGFPALPPDLTPKTLHTYAGIRLPTEWEWQWAATGGDGREYPWGDGFDSAKCNTSESGLSRTTAVGMYPAGQAPCGGSDMSGNVFEWCLNEHDEPANINIVGNSPRVVRGGSWYFRDWSARAAFRLNYDPLVWYTYIGFRVVVGSHKPGDKSPGT